MREIKFRGKRVDNGEWVYGLPVNYCNKTYVLVLTDFEEERVYEVYPHEEMWPYEVVPETVGQYTGVKDRNGVEIYEGDIITTDLERNYLIVEYRNGSFMLNCNDGSEDYYDIFFSTSEEPTEVYKYGEVIGNIHDDSVLIEEMNNCQLTECLTGDPTDDTIQQLIEDIELNEWYCDVGIGESSLLDWEKSLIIKGLRSLFTKEINQ